MISFWSSLPLLLMFYISSGLELLRLQPVVSSQLQRPHFIPTLNQFDGFFKSQAVYCTPELHDLFCREPFRRVVAEIPNLGVLKADDADIGRGVCLCFPMVKVLRRKGSSIDNGTGTRLRLRTLSVVGSMTLPLSMTWVVLVFWTAVGMMTFESECAGSQGSLVVLRFVRCRFMVCPLLGIFPISHHPPSKPAIQMI